MMQAKKIAWLNKGLILLLFGAFVAGAGQVFAANYWFDQGGHNYYTHPQIIQVEDQTLYIYGTLSPGQTVIDYYQLDFVESHPEVEIALLLPRTEKAGFRPEFVFTDFNARRMEGEVPLDFPSTYKGKVYTWKGIPPQTETNPAIGAVYVVGPGFTKQIAGSHLLAIYDPQGTGGRYVVKIGLPQLKPDTLQDKLKYLFVWLRTKLYLY